MVSVFFWSRNVKHQAAPSSSWIHIFHNYVIMLHVIVICIFCDCDGAFCTRHQFAGPSILSPVAPPEVSGQFFSWGCLTDCKARWANVVRDFGLYEERRVFRGFDCWSRWEVLLSICHIFWHFKNWATHRLIVKISADWWHHIGGRSLEHFHWSKRTNAAA